jgi:hypothetical protein
MNTCATCNWWNKVGDGKIQGVCEYAETDADTYHGMWLWGYGPEDPGLANRFKTQLRTRPTHECAGWQDKTLVARATKGQLPLFEG